MKRDEKLVIQKLTNSLTYQRFTKAVRTVTGLPVSFRALDSFALAYEGDPNANLFCQRMARSDRSCAACLLTQARVASPSRAATITRSCFAGLLESAIPVTIGDHLLGHLMIGQAFTQRPTADSFNAMAARLNAWGVPFDRHDLHETYFATPFISQARYDATVRLLEVLAEHLQLIANDLMMAEITREHPKITLARRIIAEKSTEPLHLADVSRALHVNRYYFCKLFKKSTGMTFTTYLSRVRTEQAKLLLLNPHRTISEVAFEVGFGSISTFARIFRRIVGMAPSDYRQHVAHRTSHHRNGSQIRIPQSRAVRNGVMPTVNLQAARDSPPGR